VYVPTENDNAADSNADLQALTDPAALLAELRVVHVPEASMLPALGWWLLMLVLGLVVWLLWQWRKRYLRDAWRREALLEVRELNEVIPAATPAQLHTTVRSASVLLRRVMMRVHGRTAVAGLTDEQWVRALQSPAGVPRLQDHLQALLTDVPYQPQAVATTTAASVNELLQWMSMYIERLPANSVKHSA